MSGIVYSLVDPARSMAARPKLRPHNPGSSLQKGSGPHRPPLVRLLEPRRGTKIPFLST